VVTRRIPGALHALAGAYGVELPVA
jgi:hypothetical protein